jgi:hypothetical protein
MKRRIAIAQINMHWTTTENLAAIRQAMNFAQSQGAHICAFSELAVTGFHRQIAREATPEVVSRAIKELHAYAANLSLGIAVGAPTFGDDGAKFNSHYLINERGATTAVIAKQGLTEAEATFFSKGSSRPVGQLHHLIARPSYAAKCMTYRWCRLNCRPILSTLFLYPVHYVKIPKNHVPIHPNMYAISSCSHEPPRLMLYKLTGPTP